MEIDDTRNEMEVTEIQSQKIQVLRGIAIIAVICIHCVPGGVFSVLARPFLNFAVGVFLFLSGLLSNRQKWKPSKRMLKIVIPYMVWTLIYTVIYYWSSPKLIVYGFIKNALTANSAAIMYYVFVYCQLTLLMPLIDRLARSKYKYIGFAISPLEILIMRSIPSLCGFEFNESIELIMYISCLGWFFYYYLGYILGNNLLSFKMKKEKLYILWLISIIIQMAEGYIYYRASSASYGTQLKLSALLTGSITVLLAYQFIISDRKHIVKLLKIIGDYSFGVFFSHLAVLHFLKLIPKYETYTIFPINAVNVLIVTLGIVLIGKKIFGRFSKLLAF